MKKLYALLVAASMSVTGFAQLASWDLNGITGAVPGSLNATQANVNLQTPVLSRGPGLIPASLNYSYNSNQTNVAAPNNTKANAIASGEYYQFTIQANPLAFVSLSNFSVRMRRNAAGANSYRWAYSTNGTVFTELGGADSTTSNTFTNGIDTGPFDLSGIPALQNVPSALTITFRMYVWGATGAAGGIAIGRFAQPSTSPSLVVNGTMSGVLPATLLRFYAKPMGEDLGLFWATGTEVNTSHWNVLKSLDGRRFQPIGRVEAVGNSTVEKQYQFVDAKSAGTGGFYQLAQVDKDGREELSKVVYAGGGKANLSLKLMSQSPNVLQVGLAAAKLVQGQLFLTDAAGRLRWQQAKLSLTDGHQTFSIPLSSYEKGLFQLTLITLEGERQTLRFVR